MVLSDGDRPISVSLGQVLADIEILRLSTMLQLSLQGNLAQENSLLACYFYPYYGQSCPFNNSWFHSSRTPGRSPGGE
jgi:hypothetical protein